MNRALAKHGWLTAAAIAVFGGVDPPKRQVTNHGIGKVVSELDVVCVS